MHLTSETCEESSCEGRKQEEKTGFMRRKELSANQVSTKLLDHHSSSQDNIPGLKISLESVHLLRRAPKKGTRAADGYKSIVKTRCDGQQQSQLPSRSASLRVTGEDSQRIRQRSQEPVCDIIMRRQIQIKDVLACCQSLPPTKQVLRPE